MIHTSSFRQFKLYAVTAPRRQPIDSSPALLAAQGTKPCIAGSAWIRADRAMKARPTGCRVPCVAIAI